MNIDIQKNKDKTDIFSVLCWVESQLIQEELAKLEYKTLFEEFEFCWTQSVTENVVLHYNEVGYGAGTCVRNIFRSDDSDIAIINKKSFVEKVC